MYYPEQLNSNRLVTFCSNFRIHIKMIKPMVINKGQRFTIRSPNTTIGTGVVTEILPNLTESERAELLLSRKKREKLAKKLAENN